MFHTMHTQHTFDNSSKSVTAPRLMTTDTVIQCTQQSTQYNIV